MFPGKLWRARTFGYTCHTLTIGQQVKPESELLMLVSVGAEHFSLLPHFSSFLFENSISPDCLQVISSNHVAQVAIPVMPEASLGEPWRMSKLAWPRAKPKKHSEMRWQRPGSCSILKPKADPLSTCLYQSIGSGYIDTCVDADS